MVLLSFQNLASKLILGPLKFISAIRGYTIDTNKIFKKIIINCEQKLFRFHKVLLIYITLKI